MIEVKPTKPLVHTVATACQALRVSRTKFYNAIQKGEIRVIKFGRSTRIHEAEVERIAREGLA
jgi:excisionase family DNA binding protein